ncbi:DUF6090 family protein [Flavobacteriaceae bacterium D16]|nr:DUF6090 family protein [Flavobacteriaceae bacterium D16]
MIKFFRKIRQKLLTENKFRQYIIYAIGEIFLVVIGILIALQINNWNENRKKLKLKASYETSLRNDLSLDTLMLGKLIEENYRVLKSLQMQQKRILKPDTPIDTLVQIAKNEFDPEFNVRFRYNRKTINTLIASGNIDLFSKEINEMLMTLISLQETERENSEFYSEVYASKISRYSDDYPVSGHVNSNIFNLIWTDLNEKKLASRFMSLTDLKGYGHYSFISEIERVKQQTTSILNLLNQNNEQ